MKFVEEKAGWQTCRLSDVAKIVRGITFPTDAKRHEPLEGYIACLRTANVQTKVEWGDLWYVPRRYVKNAEQYVRDGDVLISTANSYELVGKVARVNALTREASLGAFISLFRAEVGMSDAYFFYLVSSEKIQRAIRGMASTTTNLSNVSGAKLQELLLPIAPPAEQIRIVDKLEELLSDLDAGVAELKAAQKKLAQYRQSLLKAAVEGRLTEAWRAQRGLATDSEESGAQLLARILRERRARWEAKQLTKFKAQGKAPPQGWQAAYPEPAMPDKADLPELPSGWVWSAVGQCFYVGVGATPSRKLPAYWNGETPWVSSGEVRFNRITATKEHISSSGLQNSSTRINPIGSVMLGMIGEGKTRGQVAILDVEAANNQNCAAIWVTETDIAPEFVYYWLWSRYDETRRGSSGNNQPALNKSIVEAIPFPVPPLNELTAIIELVNAGMTEASNHDVALEYALRQSAAQRKNILQSAFSGQLVAQDPNDEPASVLLAHIRAERGAQSQAGGASRRQRRVASE